MPDGPPIWICGDCHVGNLGPIADLKGHIDVQVRDLDQTVIRYPANDLIRLGLSLATAARSSDLPGDTTARMIEEMVGGYRSGLEDRHRHSRAQDDQSEIVNRVMQQASQRRWKHLAEERIENVRPTIPRGDKFWEMQKFGGEKGVAGTDQLQASSGTRDGASHSRRRCSNQTSRRGLLGEGL